MNKLVRVAAAGTAALLTTAAGVLGAGAAAAADREYGTDGTRVTSVGQDDRDFGTDGTRVTSDNKDWSAGHDWNDSVPADREY